MAYEYRPVGHMAVGEQLTYYFEAWGEVLQGWYGRPNFTIDQPDTESFIFDGYMYGPQGGCIQMVDAVLDYPREDTELIGSRLEFTYTPSQAGDFEYRLGYSETLTHVPLSLSGVPAGSRVTVDAIGSTVTCTVSGQPPISVEVELPDWLDPDERARVCLRPSAIIYPQQPIDLSIAAYPSMPPPINVPAWSLNDISVSRIRKASNGFWSNFRRCHEK